ncbi:hypothetical protein JR316_0006869 [Psilocybe cubensis]|uniref:Uncharacterized protein n=2 Tax=Psilocybe cubensis TaxID=181762 RepID=A0ACB8GXH1_PSICU|nr:hypothetical protein JR316_0006869 [Psilocybe cubensis]KAH9480271.1 hypothetical protein JR316_0006869 [Psilocybe cubensis]
MASLFKLNTISGCQQFVDSQPPNVIADQILQDQRSCRDGDVPSLVVHCLPPHTDQIALSIGDKSIPISVARKRFSSIVSMIKSHMNNLSRSSGNVTPPHMIPSDEEYKATLKVLSYLQLPDVGLADSSTPLEHVLESIKTQLQLGPCVREAIMEQRCRSIKRCYMCCYAVSSVHPFYQSLCLPCGEFNITSWSLSLPTNLQLAGKTALVTGGRINLGYHTALRLLRCGANVVVSSRYPMDAEKRYLQEHDSNDWLTRLKIVGADFRAASDVFALVNAVIACLKEWNTKNKPKLDILINNAAQTLTDSVDKERKNVQREAELSEGTSRVVSLNTRYQPRVRGGVVGQHIQSVTDIPNIAPMSEQTNSKTTIASQTSLESSWIQRISEIPYEDVISAHSVNTFVPFILVRELLPYMSANSLNDEDEEVLKSTKHKPTGYIVNVSSREGIFEKTPGHRAKDGSHVHTNMSKAALNMITETEATTAWKNGRVAMNTVDPGYMSADPIYMEMVGRAGTPCPIGWEDGAGRDLWPVAKGEKGEIIRGRFLKHFAEINVFR